MLTNYQIISQYISASGNNLFDDRPKSIKEKRHNQWELVEEKANQHQNDFEYIADLLTE